MNRLVFMTLFHFAGSVFQCAPIKPFLRYYKTRPCHRSTQNLISWKSVGKVGECAAFARQKSAFAFNFRPPEAADNSTNTLKSCQILGCPETFNSSTLAFDESFDYYSAFGNFNATENATCLRSVGLFQIQKEKLNYTEAINFCQNLGADLADILSESRTNSLANLVKGIITGFYQAAYVGLDDITSEGTFLNPMDYPLSCSRFRAWSPGHPRPKKKHDDCVILDADRVWRVINCKKKLGFICEFYPEGPQENEWEKFGEKLDCDTIKNKKKKEECLEEKELYEVYQNFTREDKCALLFN